MRSPTDMRVWRWCVIYELRINFKFNKITTSSGQLTKKRRNMKQKSENEHFICKEEKKKIRTIKNNQCLCIKNPQNTRT